MLVATPIDGWHYFVDIFAGIAIAMLSLHMARSVVARLAAHPALMNAALAPAPVQRMPATAPSLMDAPRH